MNYYIKVCPVCNKEFVPERRMSVYCSKECYLLNNRRKALLRYRDNPRAHSRKEFIEFEEAIEPDKAYFGEYDGRGSIYTPVVETISTKETRSVRAVKYRQPRYRPEKIITNGRKRMLKTYPKCARCGFNKIIMFHDIIPRMEGGNPSDYDNLLPICPNCHFLLHRNRWKLWELELDMSIFESQYWLIQILKSENYTYKR